MGDLPGCSPRVLPIVDWPTVRHREFTRDWPLRPPRGSRPGCGEAMQARLGFAPESTRRSALSMITEGRDMHCRALMSVGLTAALGGFAVSVGTQVLLPIPP